MENNLHNQVYRTKCYIIPLSVFDYVVNILREPEQRIDQIVAACLKFTHQPSIERHQAKYVSSEFAHVSLKKKKIQF
jgi:hypothetical protein